MVECNRGCGSIDLHWKVVNNNYKLFHENDLLHICNDGELSNKKIREKATAAILTELGLTEPAEIPAAEVYEANTNKKKKHNGKPKSNETLWPANNINSDASKCFTITTTVNGIAITGDDKHNAIFLPKIAVSELVKALVDFI